MYKTCGENTTESRPADWRVLIKEEDEFTPKIHKSSLFFNPYNQVEVVLGGRYLDDSSFLDEIGNLDVNEEKDS